MKMTEMEFLRKYDFAEYRRRKAEAIDFMKMAEEQEEQETRDKLLSFFENETVLEKLIRKFGRKAQGWAGIIISAEDLPFAIFFYVHHEFYLPSVIREKESFWLKYVKKGDTFKKLFKELDFDRGLYSEEAFQLGIKFAYSKVQRMKIERDIKRSHFKTSLISENFWIFIDQFVMAGYDLEFTQIRAEFPIGSYVVPEGRHGLKYEDGEVCPFCDQQVSPDHHFTMVAKKGGVAVWNISFFHNISEKIGVFGEKRPYERRDETINGAIFVKIQHCEFTQLMVSGNVNHLSIVPLRQVLNL